MRQEFRGTIWSWRGPAPHHFVTVPEDECEELQEAAALVTYGWGMIPVTVRMGETEWTTSLFPKDGGYIVPIKAAARRSEDVGVGDEVLLQLLIAV